MSSIIIVAGEDAKIRIELTDEEGKFYDLSGMTEAEFRMKNADNTAMSVTLTGGQITIVDAEPKYGWLDVVIGDALTALLKQGPGLDAELVLDEGAKRSIIQFPKMAEVKKRLI